MNNIRKIIEERLENANLDASRYRENDETLNFMKVRGQADAYIDCLNLFPAPRTENELLKEFEKLGYVIKNDEYELIFEKENKVQGGKYIIHIDKEFKTYTKLTCFDCRNHLMHTTMQEHKLLNELFICWGWL